MEIRINEFTCEGVKLCSCCKVKSCDHVMFIKIKESVHYNSHNLHRIHCFLWIFYSHMFDKWFSISHLVNQELWSKLFVRECRNWTWRWSINMTSTFIYKYKYIYIYIYINKAFLNYCFCIWMFSCKLNSSFLLYFFFQGRGEKRALRAYLNSPRAEIFACLSWNSW